VRAAIVCGARTETAVGAACGAGTGCGMCLDRISDMIDNAPVSRVDVPAPREETLTPLAA